MCFVQAGVCFSEVLGTSGGKYGQHICNTIWLQLAGVHMKAQALVKTIMAREMPLTKEVHRNSCELRVGSSLRGKDGVKIAPKGTCRWRTFKQ